MSHCVEKLPHSCGSSDALQVFEDKGVYTGFCFACNEYDADPYKEKPEGYRPVVKIKTQEDIAREVAEVSELGSVSITSRKLSKAALDYFGMKVGVSEADGSTPNMLCVPMLKGDDITGWKVNLLDPKKIWSVGEVKGADPPGWKQALASGSSRLYITEGEKDMVSVFQTIMRKQKDTQYADNIPAVISLPSGSSSVKKLISDKGKAISDSFKDIYIVFDSDKAGQDATHEALGLLPGAKVVKIPGKDANDCVVNGKEKALANALLFGGETLKNSNTVNINDFYEQALQPVEFGISFPWEGLNNQTRGLRYGETYYIGAGVKMGKSDVANALAVWFSTEHNLNVYMAKPEDSMVKLSKKLYGKAVGKVFHDPKRTDWKPEDMKEGADKINGRIHLLNKYQHVGWDTLKKDIYNAVASLDVKIVMIDPITNLTNGVDPSAADTLLKQVAQDLAAMALDLDIAIFIFCHLKSPESGPAHERGGDVYSHQFAGSRGMMRSCNYMLGLQGNKDPGLPIEEKNLRQLVMLEDREFGEGGIVPMYWDHNTELFNEIKEH